MEQIKSNNFKTTVIMENLINRVKNIFSKPVETKEEVVAEKKEAVIDLDKEFTLDVINTKEFVQWLKQDIKNLVADQKIAKRDRKDVNHPCPEKRVYLHAADRVNSNREKLRFRYLLYYLLRKVRDFRWDQYRVIDHKYYKGHQYINYDYTLTEYMFHHSCKIDKILSDHGNWNYVQGQILNVVKDYVKFTSD
jgi:hypothetical protein